jgi:hypothetical protein
MKPLKSRKCVCVKWNLDFEILRSNVCKFKITRSFYFNHIFLFTNRIIIFNYEIFNLTLNNL